MDDTVHVEIQVVKLLAIGVWLGRVNRNDGAIGHSNRLILDDGRDDLGILGGQPPESRRNTHLAKAIERSHEEHL